jgi:hypothetical protein
VLKLVGTIRTCLDSPSRRHSTSFLCSQHFTTRQRQIWRKRRQQTDLRELSEQLVLFLHLDAFMLASCLLLLLLLLLLLSFVFRWSHFISPQEVRIWDESLVGTIRTCLNLASRWQSASFLCSQHLTTRQLWPCCHGLSCAGATELSRCDG